MKKITGWINFQTKTRPFFCALVILLLVCVPGYLKITTTANNAADTAKELKVVTAQQKEQDRLAALSACQIRNTGTKNGRDRFTVFFNALEAIFTNTPGRTAGENQQVKDFVNSLRAAVPLDPNAEDVDCNKNGSLDPGDYG